jgi:PadR family transcriptional regulator PadR
VARDAFFGHLDLLLLTAVRAQPRHGYAIIEYLRTASRGEFDYPEGTIYPALHRLEDGGFIRSRWREVEGRRRRVYALTAAGRRALAGRRRAWETFANTVNAVLEQS